MKETDRDFDPDGDLMEEAEQTRTPKAVLDALGFDPAELFQVADKKKVGKEEGSK